MVGGVPRSVIGSADCSCRRFDAFATTITAITTYGGYPTPIGGCTPSAVPPTDDTSSREGTLTLGDSGDRGDKVPDRLLRNHGGHRRCGRVGAAIDPIGASRSGERVVVGTGGLVEMRED